MKKGFTLIELLIVVIIVGILATAALPRYNKVIERARSAEALVLLAGIRTGQLIYFQDKGGATYSNDLGELIVTLPEVAPITTGYSYASKYWDFTMSESGATGYIAKAQRKGTTGETGAIGVDQDGEWYGDHPGKPSF